MPPPVNATSANADVTRQTLASTIRRAMIQNAHNRYVAMSPRRLLALAAMVLLAIFAGYRAWIDVFTIGWQDPEQSQVLLALPAFITLLCFRREALAAITPTASLIGVFITAAGLGLSWVGYFNAYQSIWHFGALLAVVGAAWSVLGDRLMLKALPALIALVALVPVPNLLRQDIALPLQQMTAAGAEFALIAFGFDVERIGMTLFYQDKPVTIEEACNGMRMVFALALVCYTFVMSMRLNLFARIMLLGFSPLLAVLCNIIRVVPTVVIYGVHGDDAGDVFHDMSGWAMIVLAALLLLGLIRLLDWAEVPIYIDDKLTRSKPTPMPHQPSRGLAFAAPTLVALLLFAAGGYSLSIPGAADAQAYHRAVSAAADATPMRIAGMRSEPIEIPEGSLKLLRPNTARAVQYTDEETGVSGQFLLIQSKDARDL
ncbi:MAG: exosortase/archaeosortase family protein, partial [Phycisphaeraceae bacterium]